PPLRLLLFPYTTLFRSLKALLADKSLSPLARLNEKCRLRVFLVDRPEGVRALKPSESDSDQVDGAFLAPQLSTSGQVTALGKALDRKSTRLNSSHLGIS